MGWWVEKGGCELKKCVCSVTTVDDSDEKKKLQVEPKPYAHNKSTGALLSQHMCFFLPDLYVTPQLELRFRMLVLWCFEECLGLWVVTN